MRSIITKNPGETQKFAGELAKKLTKKSASKSALVVALEGELGSGKTTFIKGFSRALGIREKVLSPTFVLIHRHKLNYRSNWSNKSDRTNKSYRLLFHIDAYRLKSKKDLLKLGVKETFSNPENIVLIEWADRVKKAIPKTAIWIHLDHLDKSKRRIIIG